MNENIIQNTTDSAGFSSFDLRIGNKYHVMKGGIKGEKNLPYSGVLNSSDFVESSRDFTEGQDLTLIPKKTYVFPLKEYLKIDKKYEIFGFASGKSTIGRLDVLTRLIADGSGTYDEIQPSCSGGLYLEVTPITFPVIVKEGTKLAQLRLFHGTPSISQFTSEEFNLYPPMLLKKDGEKVKMEADFCYLHLNLDPVCIGDKEIYAFVARSDDEKPPIDLTIDLREPKNLLDPSVYWERIEKKDRCIMIEPERFYILRSLERFKLPEDVAVYGHPVSETLGEIRIHYAGFVHPSFGKYREDQTGTPLIFEVRGHNVNTFLRHGEAVAKLNFYKMSQKLKITEEDKKKERDEGYDKQELKLSNYFSDWK